MLMCRDNTPTCSSVNYVDMWPGLMYQVLAFTPSPFTCVPSSMRAFRWWWPDSEWDAVLLLQEGQLVVNNWNLQSVV